MQIQINNHKCVVTREPGDPKFYGVRNAAGESRLLYAVKQELNRRGYDLIKKRMHKDGHMVDDMQQYLRSRKLKPGAIAIYNPSFLIRGAEEDYNHSGTVTLSVHTLIDEAEA